MTMGSTMFGSTISWRSHALTSSCGKRARCWRNRLGARSRATPVWGMSLDDHGNTFDAHTSILKALRPISITRMMKGDSEHGRVR